MADATLVLRTDLLAIRKALRQIQAFACHAPECSDARCICGYLDADSYVDAALGRLRVLLGAGEMEPSTEGK